ncbi:MAG: substrate-binding domain-containing protein [Akkermansiaceae bacterium]|nr:substrate-binding domain-containing protein [Akkermansiaceae bacterium]
MIELGHRLEAVGHVPFFTDKTLMDLGMDVRRVARYVKKTGADAWIVSSASRDVLQWFVEYEKPAFALFGRRSTLPIAAVGPDHVKADQLLVRRLVALGHQRIVILVQKHRRLPEPGQAERAILEEMQAHGIQTSSYNLPDWDNTPEGFNRLLDELFRVTPPTALIIDEPFLFHAAKDHLARHGIFAPDQVSLICSDPDPTFAWCRPTIAHFVWDYRPVVRRVVRWVENVAKGKEDQRQTLTKIEFVEGGTVGPVKGF